MLGMQRWKDMPTPQDEQGRGTFLLQRAIWVFITLFPGHTKLSI